MIDPASRLIGPALGPIDGTQGALCQMFQNRRHLRIVRNPGHADH
jgi:hypothetical protein